MPPNKRRPSRSTFPGFVTGAPNRTLVQGTVLPTRASEHLSEVARRRAGEAPDQVSRPLDPLVDHLLYNVEPRTREKYGFPQKEVDRWQRSLVRGKLPEGFKTQAGFERYVLVRLDLSAPRGRIVSGFRGRIGTHPVVIAARRERNRREEGK